MDEPTKTEIRNYLTAAGFFTIAAFWTIWLITAITKTPIQTTTTCRIIIDITLLFISITLLTLRKRDMLALLFIMTAFQQLALEITENTNPFGLYIAVSFPLFIAFITLFSNEKDKWILSILPLLFFVGRILYLTYDANSIEVISEAILILILTTYFALSCASQKITLPAKKILTANETTDFKTAGPVLGYITFALTTGAYAHHYFQGENPFPITSLMQLETLTGILLILVAILLFTLAQMRFTPTIFLLLGITNILTIYSTGIMFIGIAILLIILGTFAFLKKPAKPLPGIMLIIYGSSEFFTGLSQGALPSNPIVSGILNLIPCLLALYLGFIVYLQKKPETPNPEKTT